MERRGKDLDLSNTPLSAHETDLSSKIACSVTAWSPPPPIGKVFQPPHNQSHLLSGLQLQPEHSAWALGVIGSSQIPSPEETPPSVSTAQSRLFQSWALPVLLQHLPCFPVKTLPYSWSWLPPLGLTTVLQSLKPVPDRWRDFSIILNHYPLPSPQETPQNLCSSPSRRPAQGSRHKVWLRTQASLSWAQLLQWGLRRNCWGINNCTSLTVSRTPEQWVAHSGPVTIFVIIQLWN